MHTKFARLQDTSVVQQDFTENKTSFHYKFMENDFDVT